MQTHIATKPNGRTIWTVAALCRAIDNPNSTPEDIRAAQRWSAITPITALAWLRGFNAGLRANGAPPVLLDRTN